MFQFGKVLKVFKPEDKEIESGDKSVQALVEMWDEVILTTAVMQNIEEKLKAGDFVITEISPLSPNLYRHTIVKALRGKAGLEAWNEYKKVFNKRKEAEMPQMDLDIPKGRGMIR